MKRSIKLERTYPHPVDRVWHAITDSSAIAAWLMPNDFEPVEGREFTLTTEPQPGFDGIVHCKVLEIVDQRKMVWSWQGGNIDTILTLQLEPHPKGTRFSVEQSGFEGFGAILTSFILGAGSKKIYGKLLPGVLDQLAAAKGENVPSLDASCEKEGGLWKVLATVFSPILGRGK